MGDAAPSRIPLVYALGSIGGMLALGALLVLSAVAEGSLHAHMWLFPLIGVFALIAGPVGWLAGKATVAGLAAARRRAGQRSAIHTPMGTGNRCPFCHDAVEQAQGVACSACLARHHLACWDDHAACSACGSVTRYGAVEGAGPRGRVEPPLVKDGA